MTNTSSEEEFELNYVKIDSKNEIRLIGVEDYEIEFSSLMFATKEYQDENIGKKISQFLKKTIQESEDMIKLSFE